MTEKASIYELFDKKKTTPSETVSSGEVSAYAQAALDQETGRVATAPEGTRNDTLNRAAFALGQLVAGGEVPEHVARDRLSIAAQRAGLGAREAEGTITSGITAGCSEPRTAPERPAAPAVSTLDARAAGDDPEGRRPRIWAANELRPAAQPQWLAKNRIPKNAVTILIGDEGIGKSLLWVWISAAITTGNPLPEFGIPARKPQKVLVVVTEDDWSTTVRPRLEVAGADLDNINVICTDDDGTGTPTFPGDLDLIRADGEQYALIVVDAFLDTVYSGLTMKDPQQARQALHPWSQIASQKHASILLLTHTNRVVSRSPRDKYGITGELRKKARMTLFAQQDEDGNLTVGPEKSNITRSQPAGMFTIRSVGFFDATEDHDGTVPLLSYIGDSDRTASDYIAEAFDRQQGADPEDQTEVEQWLQDYLTPGQKPKKEVVAAGKAERHSERSIERAKKKLRVKSELVGFPCTAYWSLPDSSATGSPHHSATGGTGGTGSDLHKHTGGTAQSRQFRHTQSNGGTDGGTAKCTVCLHPLTYDDGSGTHPSCD